jgi:hypothetical protein
MLLAGLRRENVQRSLTPPLKKGYLRKGQEDLKTEVVL